MRANRPAEAEEGSSVRTTSSFQQRLGRQCGRPKTGSDESEQLTKVWEVSDSCLHATWPPRYR